MSARATRRDPGLDAATFAGLAERSRRGFSVHEAAAAPHSGHEVTASKNQPGGYPGLDAAGVVDPQQVPPSFARTFLLMGA